MSAQNSAGIQTLLEAERKAHDIVQNARTFRTQRLKSAKADAASEIEAYKKQKEAEFQKFEADHSGSSTKDEEEANESVKSELEHIKKQAAEGEAQVIDRLLEAVSTPTPKLHINA
ncbi:uncharacterized protein SAPINGB_P002787 [Magnusiomyces paraingens]|uniref:V-type proton ATPase subunit G n=1 Tax=Magnusiomyces paraingens TaxID=2606893 RepID=A0A5E8BHJ5_9ASCO|nr:uncharacterized protein SAPINGB_P002787 [Saprochaete ingens]VVT50509.1 unnamed protein product [Saprochaete ingens]